MDQMPMAEDTVSYFLMLLFYSGAGAWLVDRLMRTRADERLEERQRIAETLSFLEGMTRARDALRETGAPAAQIAAYDSVRERLSREAGDMVAELNMIADRAISTPSSRYVLLPTPRSSFGVAASFVFGAAVYLGLMAWLTLAFKLWQTEGFADFITPESQTVGLVLSIGGLGLLTIALLARRAAFWSYDVVTKRRHAEAQARMSGAA